MPTELPEPSFLAIIQLHQIQAMLHLGLLPDPQSGQPAPVDTARARFELELLGILREKTSGHLDPEETELLEEVISSLEHAISVRESGGAEG